MIAEIHDAIGKGNAAAEQIQNRGNELQTVARLLDLALWDSRARHHRHSAFRAPAAEPPPRNNTGLRPAAVASARLCLDGGWPSLMPIGRLLIRVGDG